MHTSLVRVALGAAVTIVAAFALRPMLWPARPATAGDQPAATASAKPVTPPATTAVVRVSATETIGGDSAVKHPEALATADGDQAVLVAAMIDDDDDPGFSFAESKGERRPVAQRTAEPSPAPAVPSLPPDREPSREVQPILAEQQATSVASLPKDEQPSPRDVQPTPAEQQAAAVSSRPKDEQPSPRKVQPTPAEQQAAAVSSRLKDEQPSSREAQTTPADAKRPAPEAPDELLVQTNAVALTNPYERALPPDHNAATRRVLRAPAPLRGPTTAQPLPQTNPRVRPTTIPAAVAESAKPAAKRVSADVTPNLKVAPPEGSAAAMREQLMQPESVGGTRQKASPPTAADAGPREPAARPLRNPFEAGIPHDQPLRQSLPRMTSVHRPDAEKLLARSRVDAPALPNANVDGNIQPASHQGSGAAGPVERAVYWMGYGDAAADRAAPAAYTPFPNSAAPPTGVPGASLAPQGGQANPATFFPPPAGPAAGAAAASGGVSAGAPSREGPMTICEGTQILARVGSDVILLSEVAAQVNELFAANQDKLPPDPDSLEKLRQEVTRQMLQNKIQTKLAYLDVRRNYPKEGVEKQEKFVAEAFDRDEITRMMAQLKLNSREELDAVLKTKGSSLEKERRAFVEKTMAQMRIRDQVKPDAEVGPEEMRQYYLKNVKEFETPAQVRWEEIEVRFAKHAKREEAAQTIAALGNLVMQGAPFAEIARTRSEGTAASAEGKRDWVNQGALASEQLDQALFTLPIGAMSQIIEDKNGYRIVRVIERKQAERRPFLEAQVDIRKKIREQRRENDLKQYMVKLREQIPVWTVYDNLAEKPAATRR